MTIHCYAFFVTPKKTYLRYLLLPFFLVEDQSVRNKFTLFKNGLRHCDTKENNLKYGFDCCLFFWWRTKAYLHYSKQCIYAIVIPKEKERLDGILSVEDQKCIAQ